MRESAFQLVNVFTISIATQKCAYPQAFDVIVLFIHIFEYNV